MHVELRLHKEEGRVTGGSAKVIRGTGPKIYKETAFWQDVRRSLMKQGYDVIKKLMWKDGHMVDDTQYYVRSRKYTPDSFMLSQTDYAIRAVYDEYNKEGEVTLAVDGSLSGEGFTRYQEKSTRRSPGKTHKSKTYIPAGLGGMR